MRGGIICRICSKTALGTGIATSWWLRLRRCQSQLTPGPAWVRLIKAKQLHLRYSIDDPNKLGKNSVMASPRMYLSATEDDRKVEIIYTLTSWLLAHGGLFICKKSWSAMMTWGDENDQRTKELIRKPTQRVARHMCNHARRKAPQKPT